ncbi:MAG TPA: DUF2794 domain-containing protein [Telmatospirillum sp.]|nr:DUF2794 domain-containing protein [Telmatospirillum sp.]
MQARIRPGGGTVRFNRTELCQLLALYSRRVADGEWRDYAIDQRGGRAVFAVFRHTLDRPLFTISKIGDRERPDDWEVACGPRTLTHADTLEEALHVFDKNLRLVSP